MKYKIIVDKQPKTNPSADKKEYEIDIEELRYKDDVKDTLVITKDEDYVMRRLELSEYHVLSVLDEPKKEILEGINIELFEGDNYIYIADETGSRFYAEYLISNEFNEMYALRSEVNSKIEQLADSVEIGVNKKLEGYSTTTEMNAAIKVTADEITRKVSSVETKVDTLDSKASTAQNTADDAISKANNAQSIANSNSSKITTNTEKIAQVEETVDGITKKVSKTEETIETIEENVSTAQSTANTANSKADTAQNTANTASSKADTAQNTANTISNNLRINYYTKEETESEIKQKTDSITSEVSKTYSTKTETSDAKNEAINSANKSTDDKLKDYTATSKLATFIEQNWEYVKIAWNQISEYIQLETLNDEAIIAIRDSAKELLMALNKSGQHFYKNNKNFADIGVKSDSNGNYVAFSVNTNYNENISDGMAWGITTSSDGKFYPIFYIKNFHMAGKDAGNFGGELILAACDLILAGTENGIVSNNIKLYGNVFGGLTFGNTLTSANLLSVYDDSISLLDSVIRFYYNQAGTRSFRIGQGNEYVIITDDGTISATGTIVTKGYVQAKGYNTNSSLELKKNIEKYENSGLNEILKTDIYKFNYKNEDDTNEKTIGTIIGKDYNYSEKILSQDRNSINLYSMISVAYKAIQEQQEQIEQLKQEIKELKEVRNG